MNASWKTTLAGVAAILTLIGTGITQYLQGGMTAVRWDVLLPGLLPAVGLIFAKDWNVSNAPAPGPAQQVKAPSAAGFIVGEVRLLLGTLAFVALAAIVVMQSGCAHAVAPGATVGPIEIGTVNGTPLTGTISTGLVQGVPPGCYEPVTATVAGFGSVPVTCAVGPGSATCSFNMPVLPVSSASGTVCGP